MGTRQPARLSSTPAYGLPEAALADGRSGGPSGLVPLLLLFIGLAVATVWFVALPAVAGTARVERSCEVIVLGSGTTKCVRDPTHGARGAHAKAKRVKH